MDIRSDITSREDILQLMYHFYERVKEDELIGFIFNDIVKLDWNTHIPLIADFWESILLDNPVYHRNAMAVHHSINDKVKLEPAFFERWLSLFNNSLDQLFKGEKTELARKRAASVAALMQFKLNGQPGK